MTTTQEHPAPPGQPLPAAPQEHEPTVLVWLRKNWLFVLILAAAVAVSAFLNYVLPGMQERGRIASWNLYMELVSTPESFDAEHLPATLARSREDDRIHRWVVEQAVRQAMFQGDREALQILLPETEALVASDAFEGVAIATPDGVHDLGEYLRDRVREELDDASARREFTNPEPTGRSVRFSLKDAQDRTYELVVALYEDAAPEACAAFVAAVESGRVAQLEGQPLGTGELRFSGLDPDGAESNFLPIERQWGYFHLAGALATVARPDLGAGAQSTDQFTLLLEDRPFSDGRATVFGRVTAGEEDLDAMHSALQADPQAAGFVLVEAALLEPSGG